jgi:hypothetical protein
VNYDNVSIFKKLEAGKRIVIQHISQPHFILSVSLLPDMNGTKIVWLLEFEDAKVLSAIRHIVEPSNEQNLDRLHMHLRSEL